MGTDKTDILSLLRKSEDYVSGQQLCETFGVSRTAVWKVINQLKEEGYEIESVTRKGYRLLSCPDVFSESEIASRMLTQWAGKKVFFLDETSSTNADAKRLAEEGEPHGTLVVARKQTNGRGRRGRTWQSPEGSAVYMSLALKPDFAPDKAAMLTLVMALSVAEAITEITRLDAKIKWPNDIVVHGKKVCGILTEMSAEMDYIHYVVIGVGINTNQSQSEFEEDIREIATSLKIESGQQVSGAAVIERVMFYFEKNYDIFVRKQNLSELRECYQQRLINRDAEVRVLDPQGEYTGIARGINETGELLVERNTGEIEEVYAGEVSVRGLYGYT